MFSASIGSKLINPLLNSKFVRAIIDQVAGIDPRRRFPFFAGHRLSKWFATRGKPITDGRKVVLFNDTYTEYFLPQVGRAAVECLEAAGYQVMLATLGDSQRTAISLGLLDQAKQQGTLLFQTLSATGTLDTPILVCEPSCASSLVHDLPDILDDQVLAAQVASRVFMVDAFLEQECAAGRIQLPWQTASVKDQSRHFVVHSHCHQKTLDGGRWTHKLLQRIPGSVVSDTNAGCCGMAGSFGYEKEHAELSIKIAQQRLLPVLGKISQNTIVVTNGFSCRHQISGLSNCQPIHVVEVIKKFLPDNFVFS